MRLERLNPFTPLGWMLVLSTLSLVGSACQGALQTPAPVPEATPPPVVDPVDKGNGVYYFPATGEQFIRSLVKFYEGNGKHCDLQGVTEHISGKGSKYSFTETTGFILHCHDLAIPAQEDTVP